MKWQEWIIIKKVGWMKIWAELRQFRDLAIAIPVLDFWARDRGFSLALWQIVAVTFIGFVLVWAVSRIYDRAHMFQYEATFGNRRNPLELKKIEELTKIRKLLEKFK